MVASLSLVSAVEAAVALYREAYGGGGLLENEVYEGVPEMLAAVRPRAEAAYVVTAKFSVTARRIVTHF